MLLEAIFQIGGQVCDTELTTLTLSEPVSRARKERRNTEDFSFRLVVLIYFLLESQSR